MKTYIQPHTVACDADINDIIAVSVEKEWADNDIPVQMPRNYLDVEWEWDRSPFSPK